MNVCRWRLDGATLAVLLIIGLLSDGSDRWAATVCASSDEAQAALSEVSPGNILPA